MREKNILTKLLRAIQLTCWRKINWRAVCLRRRRTKDCRVEAGKNQPRRSHTKFYERATVEVSTDVVNQSKHQRKGLVRDVKMSPQIDVAEASIVDERL